MSRLTEELLADARPILDRYRDRLRRDRSFSAHALERELSEGLRIGYREVAGVVVGLFQLPDYRLVAVYYAESIGKGNLGPDGLTLDEPDIAAEFRVALARVYGVESHDAVDLGQARAEFWRQAFAEPGQGGLPQEEYEGPRFAANDAAGREHVLIPVYHRRTDPSGRKAGGGYEATDLIRLVTPTGGTVRRDGPGRYTILDGGSHGAVTTLTSRHPKAV